MNMRETMTKIIKTSDDHDVDVEVVAAWVDYCGDVDDAIRSFAEAYQGVHHSLKEFWEEFIADNFDFDVQKMQELCLRLSMLSPEVDLIAVAQDYYHDDDTGAVFFVHAL